MKSFFYILLVVGVLISCNDNKVYNEKIARLEKSNDSLQSILDTLKTKFIFDHAFFRHIPANNKELKVGEKYTGEFFYVAYNDDDRILFSQNSNSVSFDTLTVKRKSYAAYVYETTAKKDTNYYLFQPLIQNSFSNEFRNSSFNSIRISDIKIIE